jgi:hypothetical protein
LSSPGFDPANHPLTKALDARVKPAHDVERVEQSHLLLAAFAHCDMSSDLLDRRIDNIPSM